MSEQTSTQNNSVLILVDRNSFPVKCPELDDFISLFAEYYEFENITTDNPSVFFQKALEYTNKYELVIPVTRNFYVRDKLKLEGVSLIISL